ncbi:PREDICTED: uncharacterized protein LOC104800969 [Tarenaya hassleriana]|uniref:uncharacterized protein LOC104800969 n=1 Tax=Tarenaya hassleriana TaxID=28532 RepID=UPI00053C2314|nr:PREDICTED: uncharacterized protein LOC104800969 [Tarenaya hassleriana]
MALLVQVLRLVDSEKKAAMPYIYEAMDNAKEVIEKSFTNDEGKYKDVIAIIDTRWDCQLHRPLHAAGHYLNPEYFYSNPGLERNMEAVDGLYQYIRRLVSSQDVQNKILGELSAYRSASGHFGIDFAIRQRKTISPAQWWKNNGCSAPNLQDLAIKILSLTCSASV